jgi:hypothetical protein
MAYTLSTQEERDKIKVLLDYGIPTAEVAKLTGRSIQFCGKIKAGTYEKFREYDRLRQQKRHAEMRKKAAEEQQQSNEEQKRQETRRRIREEAEKAGAPRFDDEQIPEKPKTLASPFSYDSLLMRIADSNDYTNALLNGVLNRLEALCKALGVIE